MHSQSCLFSFANFIRVTIFHHQRMKKHTQRVGKSKVYGEKRNNIEMR